MLYASTHQAPLFPGTGTAAEQGVGNIVNVPLHAGDDGLVFREAMESEVLPRVAAFTPISSSSPPDSTPTSAIRSARCA